MLKPCDNGYMTEYQWIPCSFDNGQYLSFIILACVALVIWVVGLPLFFMIMLWRYRRAIAAEHQRAHIIGFLYEPYRHQRYWWEMVWISRRLLLVIFINLIPDLNPFQVTSIVGTLCLFIILQQWHHPYKLEVENVMSLVTAFVELITFISGIYIAGANVDSASSSALQNVVFSVNAIMVVLFLYTFAAHYIWSTKLLVRCLSWLDSKWIQQE